MGMETDFAPPSGNPIYRSPSPFSVQAHLCGNAGGGRFILHAFQKKTQATAKRDIDIAKARFTELMRDRT